MTKGQLIKLLQESPFGDNAIITIGHNYSNMIAEIDPDVEIDIINIEVVDENELSIRLDIEDSMLRLKEIG